MTRAALALAIALTAFAAHAGPDKPKVLTPPDDHAGHECWLWDNSTADDFAELLLGLDEDSLDALKAALLKRARTVQAQPPVEGIVYRTRE